MRYEIDLSRIEDREGLFALLRRTLPLPEWCGNNLDALFDVLTEGGEPMELCVRNAAAAPEEMRAYIADLRRMLEDAQAKREGFSVIWEEEPMSRYLEKAHALRAATDRHYNCAQSVLIPFAADAGVDDETAYRLAANFGSGMRRGSVCGAITGGLMALGLFGAEEPAVVGAFYKKLREAHNGLFDCSELLRVNQQQGGSRNEHCDGMVYECVALVEALLKQSGRLAE